MFLIKISYKERLFFCVFTGLNYISDTEVADVALHTRLPLITLVG